MSIFNRIAESIYIRAIVRGKENKPMKYGIEVHINQVGGINIIDSLQVTMLSMRVIEPPMRRLKESVIRHEIMIGKCTIVAADGISLTKQNSTFLKK